MSARREEEEETVQADMLPVMNVMFLLIPALLLAMEFASMAQIPIQTPKFTGLPSTTPPTAPKQQLEFKVIIGSDGFETVASMPQWPGEFSTTTRLVSCNSGLAVGRNQRALPFATSTPQGWPVAAQRAVVALWTCRRTAASRHPAGLS